VTSNFQPSEDQQVLLPRAVHRLERNRLVEGYEAASMLQRESEQVHVRELAREPDVLIVDARSSLARESDPRTLPRSIVAGEGPLVEALPSNARSRTIITFCTCPSEASAALLAEELLKAGYDRVRVLTGGTAAVDALQDVA